MMLRNFQATIANDKIIHYNAPIRNMSSLSNNMVENWFNTLKNSILQKNKSNYFSEILTRIVNNILAKYNEYYFVKPKSSKIINDPELNKKEIWGDSKKKRKRTKGFYKKSVLKKKINNPREENNLFTKGRIDKYLAFFDKYKPTKNGLKSSINKVKIETFNTCPLDYFLLIIAGLVSLNPFFEHSKNLQLKNLFSTINVSIINRKWNLARIEWYEANPNAASKYSRNNTTIYDFYNDEEHSFLKYYSQKQTYTTIEGKTGNSFNLM